MSAAAPPPPFGRFFLPGPTDVHPDVLAAMLRPMIGHRGKEMEAILAGMAPRLGSIFRTHRPVLVGSNSATGFMEMAIRNGARRRVLSVVNGAFSDRFADIAARCGRDVVRLELPLGSALEPDRLRDALKRSQVDAVTLVHSETSTGALAPLADLAPVVHEFPDVMLLVDAVTSVAGSPVETDAWNLDFVLTGSQKALALPPGLALGVASDRMIERSKTIPGRGLYFDLPAFIEATAKNAPTNTPALSLFFALDVQLKRIEAEGGVEARWARHDAMRQTVERWSADREIEFVPVQGRRSWTVSCLKLPAGKTAKDIVGALKKQGWVIGSGYGPLKDSTIRIGHMGDHTVTGLRDLLKVLEGALA